MKPNYELLQSGISHERLFAVLRSQSSEYPVEQCCGSGSGRIQTFLGGSESGPFLSDPDPDVWNRIWIRIRNSALLVTPNSHLTFLVCVKAINTSGISFV
jgi:hypothetical protein